MGCKPFLLLLPTLFTVSSNAKNRKTEICDLMSQMAAGSGMEKPQALIPNVESGEAASAEEITSIFCCGGRTCVCEIGSKIRTERERERHKEVYLYYQNMQQLQMNNNLYKRLQSHFI